MIKTNGKKYTNVILGWKLRNDDESDDEYLKNIHQIIKLNFKILKIFTFQNHI